MPDSTLVGPPVTAARRERWLAKPALGLAFYSPRVPVPAVGDRLDLVRVLHGDGCQYLPGDFCGPGFRADAVENHHRRLGGEQKDLSVLLLSTTARDLLMAESALYSIPPAIFYYCFRRHLLSGLVTGRVAGT